MESVYTYLIFFVLMGILAVPYWIRVARHRRDAEEKLQRSVQGGVLTPVTLHPHIDISTCIGCASCVKICPESVLGIVNGRAAVVSGLKCVGHSLCADVCPVGAITMGFGTPKQGEEIPWYDGDYQTNVRGLYIVGELGGIGLIKNAVTQATAAVRHITTSRNGRSGHEYDVLIAGAGPAGLTAALAAKEQGLRYVVLEQGLVGGTILHYPRQKLILTSPVELPLYGKLKVSEIAKEDLLSLWTSIIRTYALEIRTNAKIDAVAPLPGGFQVTFGDASATAHHVILALGRRGSPRKLGVPGEDLPNVFYQLIEAETYTQNKILVVGGGDSAVEAAVALARQKGNTVTLSYRRSEFLRLKEKNEHRIRDLMRGKKINVLFQSNLREIRKGEVVVQEDAGGEHRLANDFVFIFAGGEFPVELLKRAGIRLRTRDADARPGNGRAESAAPSRVMAG